MTYKSLPQFASSLGCVITYVAIYNRDILREFGIADETLILLFCGVTLLLFSRKPTAGQAIFASITLCLALINYIASTYSVFSNYMIAPIIGMLIARSSLKLFTLLVIVHLIASVLLQFYEYQSGSYLFSVLATDGTELNAEAFAGHIGVMRAKGLFAGPLSAVSFYIIASLLVSQIWLVLVALIGAALAYGRLGITVLGFLLLALTLGKLKILARTQLILILPFILAITWTSATNQQHFDFFFRAFDFGSANNISRFLYWGMNADAYLAFNSVHAIFGNAGFAKASFGSTESDFLRILLDSGVSGLALYLIGIFLFAKYSRDSKPIMVLKLSIIVTCMMVFPFTQSLGSGVIFWVLLCSVIYRGREVKRNSFNEQTV
jgi:hypothetical protein